ncbi:MAG: TetR family transcriptional regulator, partial [Phototrophicales bacterium]
MIEEKGSKRAQLLNAASQIVLEKGAAHLTLEAVAALAGVSKGGLLYHFPSKEALIKGMLEQYLTDFSTLVAQSYAALPEGRGRWLRAYVNAS